MDRPTTLRRARALRPVRAASVALFALVLLSGPAFAGCSAAHGTTPAAASAATNTGMTDEMPMAGAGTERIEARSMAERDFTRSGPAVGLSSYWSRDAVASRIGAGTSASTPRAWQASARHILTTWRPAGC